MKITLILFLAGIIGLVWCSRDEPRPDVSDLQPRPRSLSESANALLAIRGLSVERAPAMKDEAYRAAMTLLEEEPDVWNQSAVATIVSTRADLWPRFDEAIRIPQAESALPTSSKDVVSPHIGDTRSTWTAACVRAQLVARTGSPDVGLDQALALLECTSVLTDSGGPLIDYLISAVYRGSALRSLRMIVVDSPPSDDALRAAVRRVGAMRPGSEALIETFHAEFAFNSLGLTEIVEQANGIRVITKSRSL